MEAAFGSALAASPNQTGMPDALKAGIESLSGMDMSDVRVHRNSSQPAQLNALAYAQGNDIHLGPGQEQHLPHEAWHVVQQRQGRVEATTQRAGVGVNDDLGLEQEADEMGARAEGSPAQPSANASRGYALGPPGSIAALKAIQKKTGHRSGSGSHVVQKGRVKDLKALGNSYARVIKVIMAGSGNDAISEGEAKGERFDKDQEPTAWKVEDHRKTKLSVAGPGAPSSKGFARYLLGTSDTGSNSIENNVRFVIDTLETLIKSEASNEPILLLIKAHSRNAVSATKIANFVQGKDERVRVEVVLFDPVPGPFHYGASVLNDVSAIPESTLVCSVATQYPLGFTPQQVLGAKRMIISRQHHGGGLSKGYRYNGVQYKGSRINSLPEGLYADPNKTGENSRELELLLSMEAAQDRLMKLFKRSESLSGDVGRLPIIRKQIMHYFFVRAFNDPKTEEDRLWDDFERIWRDLHGLNRRKPDEAAL